MASDWGDSSSEEEIEVSRGRPRSLVPMKPKENPNDEKLSTTSYKSVEKLPSTKESKVASENVMLPVTVGDGQGSSSQGIASACVASTPWGPETWKEKWISELVINMDPISSDSSENRFESVARGTSVTKEQLSAPGDEVLLT